MKLRCPYCSCVYGPEPRSKCPNCGKMMIVPDALRKTPRPKKTFARRERQAGGAPAGGMAARGSFMQKPVMMLVMMGVMAGLGLLLMGRAGGRARRFAGSSLVRKATAEVNAMHTALERFHADCGRCPTTQEGILALITNPDLERWGGPYVSLIRRDPWHHPYVYEVRGNRGIVSSMGPDGKPNTPDDVRPDATSP